MLRGRSAVVSTGATDDLQKARSSSGGFLKTLVGIEERDYSEHTAEIVDEEVWNRLDSSYERSKNILHERRAALKRIVKRLIDKEILDKAELKDLFQSEGVRKALPLARARSRIGGAGDLVSFATQPIKLAATAFQPLFASVLGLTQQESAVDSVCG